MNGKALIPLIAGLCVGGFALKIGYDTIKSAKGAPTVYVKVWAAKEDITRGTEISEPMLTTITYPQKSVPEGAILEKDKDKILGRVPKVDAPGSLPVLEAMLLAPGAKPGIHVKPGFRAIAVKIDESSGVDYHIQPGCRVDVVGYFTVNRAGKQEMISRTVLENAEVAAVGQRLVASNGDEKDAKGNAPKQARAVTLFVKPEYVTALHLAEQRGKIKLSMRGDEDGGSGSGRAVSDSEVIEGKKRGETSDDDDDKTAEKPEKPAGPGLMEMFAKAFAKKEAKDAAAAAPAPIVTAPPPPPAEPTWDILVKLGDRYEVLKFKNRTSRERVDDLAKGGRDAGQDSFGGATGGQPAAQGQANVVVVPVRPQAPSQTPNHPGHPAGSPPPPEPEPASEMPSPAWVPPSNLSREPKELFA